MENFLNGKAVEDVYKQLSLREQILLRPDTYIGSIEPVESAMWVVEDPDELVDIKISRKSVEYIPGFIKLFDEILTNASDHKHRGGGVKTIKVDITEDFTITVWNDGDGIPVTMHKDAGVYVPELIFGHLLTGSNYDDSQERFGGGRNGYGAKLSNIFSTSFSLTTHDGKNLYEQEFRSNLSEKDVPTITKKKAASFTQITYKPDFSILPVKGLEKDTLRIMFKRVLDIAVYNPDIKVYYNGTILPIRSLKDYAKMHLDDDAELFYEKLNDRWEVAIAQSHTDNFEQVSIVNGISTHSGGSHIEYLGGKLVGDLKNAILKGNKKINLKNNDIKNKLFMFVVAKVPNPTFDTQTKERLTNKMLDSVTKGAIVSDKTVKSIMKSAIVSSILDFIAAKEQIALSKLNKNKSTKVRVAKLQDAYKAGTKEGVQCALFITEGDSACSGCLSGLSVVGRDHYGVFPLKGKPLNVRDQAASKIKDNIEITNIMTALGLVAGKKYTDKSELRYGKLVIMSDADVDGSHIKGLVINMIHTFWPELLKMDFLYEFITPIAKVTNGKKTIPFYDLTKYYEWSRTTENASAWKRKYYKGLGTIQSNEMKELFQDLPKHLIKFEWSGDSSDNLIDMLFNKKRANDRKEFLTNYQGEITPDKFGKPNPIDDFFNTEFIQFSMSDNIRSIPQLMDGLKPSQRKILYTTFKRNLTTELKVAQLAGAVAETSEYHHGEQSLVLGIVSMAQDFVGSNNINLLAPKGQFGTRVQGGSDAASGRYIFTHLSPVTRHIFRKEDDEILNYLEEEGHSIEPDFYQPIIPMILVNGTDGIGTGWSTNIPKFSPKEIIKAIEGALKGVRKKIKLTPYYEGFTGSIVEEEDKWVSYGVYNIGKKGVIHITELPVGTWTQPYIEYLDKLIDDKVIKDYRNASTDLKVDITVIPNRETDDSGMTKLIEKLKLSSTIRYSNMHLFKGVNIVKYETPEAIMNDFCKERIKNYRKRKEAMIGSLTAKFDKLTNIARFLTLITKGKINVMNKKKAEIIVQLEAAKLVKVQDSYDYLLTLPVYSLTEERLSETLAKVNAAKLELEELQLKTAEELWLNDLAELKKFL
jgi:DNA topoisomerase II